MWVQVRQDDDFSALSCAGRKHLGVDFPVGGMVDRDTAGGAPRGQALETPQDAPIPESAQSPRQPAAAGTQIFAQIRQRQGRVVG
jgi:hypothetical protein